MIPRSGSRWLLAIACGCALALLLTQRQPLVGNTDRSMPKAASDHPAPAQPSVQPVASTNGLQAPPVGPKVEPDLATLSIATDSTRRDAFDAAAEQLQATDSGTTDLALANAIEAVWRTALDAQTALEALPLIADWLAHADPIVAERAAAAVDSLRQAQLPATEPATPPALGHERLRDLALNSPDPEIRHDAIVELALLENPETRRWLAIAATLETDPANQTLLRQLNEQ